MSTQEEKLMLRAVQLAQDARDKGNHPFGSLLADANNNILCEAENNVVTEKDVTGHAETNLVRIASRTLTAEQIAGSTLYTSTEPCPMCSGAIYWLGVKKVVYGISGKTLNEIVTEIDANSPVLELPSSEVFAKGRGTPIEVAGPLCEVEAKNVHKGFWEHLLRH
eukprot:Colp12_sorted_trinity150504_noHs@4275